MNPGIHVYIHVYMCTCVTTDHSLKGVVSKNLQKPNICGRGVYNSWGDGAYHVDTLGPTNSEL